MLRTLLFVLIALLIWLSPIDGTRTYIVDDDGFANYKTIGEAVVAANNGDTIYIKPGIYPEEVLLNKSLSLMPLTGEKGPIILEGDGKKTGISIISDSCSVDGMTLKNYTGPGINITSSKNTIKNNRFEMTNPGIIVRNSGKNTISKNFIKDCEGGVVLWTSTMDNTIADNIIDGGSVSIYLREVGKNDVIRNKIIGSSVGIWEMDSSEIQIVSNDVKSSNYAIWLFNSSNTIVSQNKAKAEILETNSSSGIYIVNCSKIEANGNEVEGGLFGMGILNSSANRLKDNSILKSIRGIYLMNTSANELDNNSIRDSEYGLTLENSGENSIKGCAVFNSTRALGLGLSSENVIENNKFQNTKDTAITMDNCNGNTLAGNQVYRSDNGMIMWDSMRNGIENNVFQEVNWGLYVDGPTRESFNNSISESNLINGKPIAYFYGQSNKAIENRELAHMTMAYCSNFTVEKILISNDALFLFGSGGNAILENNISGCYGMRLVNCADNEISGNRLIGNKFSGLYMVSSNQNQITDNTASDNNQNGISFIDCRKNTLRDNDLLRNGVAGIWINLSKDNDILQNDISNSPMGMEIMNSSGNRIYHNNFINNLEQAEDLGGNNSWDMGNVTGGNYWSDHKAKGNPSQNWPKVIKGGRKDNYPFQDKSGWKLADPAASSLQGSIPK